MKGRAAELLKLRDQDKFSNKETSGVLRGAQTRLDDEDMDVISHLATKAMENIPSKLSGKFPRKRSLAF